MLTANSIRLLVATFCAALLIVLGISWLGPGEPPAAPPLQSARPMQPQAALLPVLPKSPPNQKVVSNSQMSGLRVEESAQFSAISAFRQWAEKAMASSFTDVNESTGIELATARATAMKALIRTDPASALRQALPADLRASLPPAIAAAIEQPVKTTGMCTIRMTCNHSPDTPHGNCESTPVLLEDAYDWNAYYGSRQWRSHLGQTVVFEGVAVDGELAVQSITPTSAKSEP